MLRTLLQLLTTTNVYKVLMHYAHLLNLIKQAKSTPIFFPTFWYNNYVYVLSPPQPQENSNKKEVWDSRRVKGILQTHNKSSYIYPTF